MKQPRSTSESMTSYVATARVASPTLSSHGVERLLVQPAQRPKTQESDEAEPIHGIWLGVGVGIVLWAALAGVALWIWLS